MYPARNVFDKRNAVALIWHLILEFWLALSVSRKNKLGFR